LACIRTAFGFVMKSDAVMALETLGQRQPTILPRTIRE